jgi:hypothetical protein
VLEQALVWIITAAAAAYAVVAIVRSIRRSGDHCSDCGLDERKRDPDDRH